MTAQICVQFLWFQDQSPLILKGRTTPFTTKFVHIFVTVITLSPFFCTDTFDISLLLIVCALR